MQLDLSDSDVQLLEEVVDSAVNQLTTEISHTDNAGYRRDLKERRLRLRGLHTRLTAPGPERRAG